MGRNATGVKGMTLDDNSDEVVGMICVNDPEKAVDFNSLALRLRKAFESIFAEQERV